MRWILLDLWKILGFLFTCSTFRIINEWIFLYVSKKKYFLNFTCTTLKDDFNRFTLKPGDKRQIFKKSSIALWGLLKLQINFFLLECPKNWEELMDFDKLHSAFIVNWKGDKTHSKYRKSSEMTTLLSTHESSFSNLTLITNFFYVRGWWYFDEWEWFFKIYLL